MSVAPDSRSIHYSADATGRAGRAVCQVIRTQFVADGRMQYAIAVRNDTSHDVDVFAFVPDTLDLRHRTVTRSVIGPYADFSANVALDPARYEAPPELHVEISGEDLQFALVVPPPPVDLPADGGAERVAVAALALRNTAAAEPPGAARATAFPPPARAVPRFARQGASADRTRERPSPAAPAPDSPAVWPMLAVCGVLVSGLGVAVLRPQVSELRVPHAARPLLPITVSYRASGFGRIAYEVVGPDAQDVAAGPLSVGTGTFALRLPAAPNERAYLVRVRIAGALGGAQAEDFVTVPGSISAPAPRPARTAAPLAPPLIRSLAVDRAALPGGETLNVYYDVDAPAGDVALVDGSTQIAYGRSALGTTGHASFVVPNVQAERSLSVVLTARRGNLTAQSRVAVSVTPQASPAPAAPAASTADSADPEPAFTAPAVVTAGRPFRVDVAGAHGDIDLLLTAGDGSEAGHATLAAGQTSAILTAPLTAAREQLRLEATFTQGAGSETVVKTLTVTPG